MFNVNFLNKPGKQTKDTQSKSIVYNIDEPVSMSSEIINENKKPIKKKTNVVIKLLLLISILGSILFYYLEYL